MAVNISTLPIPTRLLTNCMCSLSTNMFPLNTFDAHGGACPVIVFFQPRRSISDTGGGISIFSTTESSIIGVAPLNCGRRQKRR